MKVRRSMCLVLPVAIAATGVAQTVRDKAQTHYDAISRLVIRKDKEELARELNLRATSNFELVDAMKNSMDIGAMVRSSLTQLSAVEAFKANENKIIGEKKAGNDLIFTVKTSYDAVVRTRGVKSRVKGVSISEDTWTKTIVGWKIRKSKTIRESVTKDGKPMRL